MATNVTSKINNSLLNKLILTGLGLLFFEQIYLVGDKVTGDNNKLITLLIILFLMLHLIINKTLFSNRILYTIGSLSLISVHFIVFGGVLSEFLRYSSLLVIIYFISNTNFSREAISAFIKVLTIGGFVYFFYNLIDSSSLLNERFSGFLKTSPTLFSFLMLISLYYLLETFKKKRDLIFIFLTLFLIVVTFSRSIILGAILVIFFSVSKSFFKKRINFSKKKLIYIVSSVIVFTITSSVILYFISNLRSNVHASNMTRLNFINQGINYLLEKPESFITGYGAGSAFSLISQITSFKTPLHFDLLTILVDYGFIGVIFLLLLPLFFIKENLIIAYFLLLLGSIHNLLYFPLGILMIFLVLNSLKYNNNTSPKILLVGSSGGHLVQLYQLKKWWEKHDRVWVTFKKEDSQSLLKKEKKYWCYHPTNRNFKNLIKNSALAIKILLKEKPQIIVSTGAASAVPFFYLGKIFGIKLIYIEVYDRIDLPTLTGKIVYPVTDHFILQWEEQKKFYPKGKVFGGLM
jgi:beta-1,4-N-acetylglucosaminyltransferase